MSIYNVIRFFQNKVRSFIRQRTLPMSVDEAEAKREFLAKIYFVSSFSAFSYFIYSMQQRKMKTHDPTVSSAETAINNFKIDGKVRVMRFEGLTKVQDYVYERKKGETEEIKNQNLDSELVVDSDLNGESEIINY